MAGVGARVIWRGVARAWWSVGAPGAARADDGVGAGRLKCEGICHADCF